MFDPRYDFWWLKPLTQMWAIIIGLSQQPTESITKSRRTFLRASAAAICLGCLGAGALFFHLAFGEADPWARFFMALFTFGLFGMPTSIAAIIVLGLLAHAHAPDYNLAAVVLMLSYLAQWQLLALGLLRRSTAPTV